MSTGGRAGEAAVTVYNPLPVMLSHYEQALMQTLVSVGVVPGADAATSAEVGGSGLRARVGAALGVLRDQGRLAAGEHRVIVCWPSFGLLEPLLWRRPNRRAKINVIVHDPRPLRRQFGTSGACGRLGSLGARAPGIGVIVHTRPARDELVRLGWPEPDVVPLPARQRDRKPECSVVDRHVVSVLGQWKPARDAALLPALGLLLAGKGFSPVIAGRGWPPIPGWQTHDGFLTEQALDARLGASACVVIPYTRFFQSGIALRALELGIPVVGPRHPFLEEVFGAAWPGLVDSPEPEAWLVAVDAVTGVPGTALNDAYEAYTRHSTDAWRRLLACEGAQA